VTRDPDIRLVIDFVNGFDRATKASIGSAIPNTPRR
jgi:hypothetical protein